MTVMRAWVLRWEVSPMAESRGGSDVLQGRKGKHRQAVADIIADLAKFTAQHAVKIPLSSLAGEKMQNLRSAVHHVTRERKTSPWKRRTMRTFTLGAPTRPHGGWRVAGCCRSRGGRRMC